ncbi:hypothetical protein ACKI16_29620 [Streptomyces scabiei]
MSSKDLAKAIKADQKAAAASAARRSAHKARVVRDGDGAGMEFPPRDDD